MENIKIYRRVIGPSHITSGNAYRIRVVNKLNGKQFYFTYNDNYLNSATDEEILFAVYQDYLASIYTYEEFRSEYGYMDEQGKAVFKAVVNNGAKVRRVLTADQLREISKLDL